MSNEIMESLKYSICKYIQSPYALKFSSDGLLRTCAIVFKYHEQLMTKDALHDVLIQTGEECKTLIDNLVQESIDTIKKSNHKPNPPKLARIECPHCGKHSHLIVRYEVGSVLHGIVFYSGGFEPVDQGPSDDYFDDREAEYYCSNCEEDFSHTEATDLISEYNMKYDKKIETDIDIFEGFWE